MEGTKAFKGVYPMLYTFFDERDCPDLPLMARQIERLIAHGSQGIGVMGLATEVHKLSSSERRSILEYVGHTVNGRVPLAVTVAENTRAGQIEFVRAAVSVGASWVLLQPPPVKNVAEIELIRFFGSIAEQSPIAVGIQNAPSYLGIGLSSGGLVELNRVHPNVILLKIEDGPLAVPSLIEETAGRYSVFVGRSGLELPDCFRAGCVGFIPGVEAADYFVRIYSQLQIESESDEADAVYREIEPIIVFVEQSLNHFITFAKEITARRLGINPVHHRLPCEIPPLARMIIDRLANRLGAL
jgi:4-hydroxy-tetrahydrodipicolinate synthase